MSIGDIVLFVDEQGKDCAAIVVGYNSFRAGSLNLIVWSNDGADVVKRGVCEGSAVGCWRPRATGDSVSH